MFERGRPFTGGFSIGQVFIPNRTVLAPMAGVTDLAFRGLCKEQGAGLVCMEMVSAKAISYKNKNTESLMVIREGERPVSLQLFGREPELMGEVARSIEEHPFDILDINMGCPVPKVVGNGEGSALLKDPLLAGRIVECVARSIRKPVTVKIRIGFSEEDKGLSDLARRLEAAGAAAIAVHGRTREQFYSGEASWDAIRRVKEAVSIPVIGNGDVVSGESALALFEQTGCDAVMVGRGSRGNPWIFRRIQEYLLTGQEGAPVDREELKRMILSHARAEVELRGELSAMREMRKHVAWYTQGIRYGAQIRRMANAIETMEQLEELLLREW